MRANSRSPLKAKPLGKEFDWFGSRLAKSKNFNKSKKIKELFWLMKKNEGIGHACGHTSDGLVCRQNNWRSTMPISRADRPPSLSFHVEDQMNSSWLLAVLQLTQRARHTHSLSHGDGIKVRTAAGKQTNGITKKKQNKKERKMAAILFTYETFLFYLFLLFFFFLVFFLVFFFFYILWFLNFWFDNAGGNGMRDKKNLNWRNNKANVEKHKEYKNQMI